MAGSVPRTNWQMTWLRHFLLIALVINGCGTRPKLSDDAFSIARTLYSVCNLQKKEQLKAIDEIVSQRAAQGTLSESEAELLREIVTQGERGKWQQAQTRVRKLLAAQNVTD